MGRNPSRENEASENGVWDIEELEDKVISPTQWGAVGAGIYKALASTHNTLPCGAYTVTMDNNDDKPIFIKRDIKTDDILLFKDSIAGGILEEISRFWENGAAFKKFGFLHRRGYLLYGPQGTGKSSIVQQIISDVVARGGIVLICENPRFFNKALATFRKAEKERNVVCIFEDIDATIKKYGEEEILSILDGSNMVDRVLNIASCFPPRVRFLTESLEWKPCGELKKGDVLWAFDEDRPKGRGARRRYKKTVVTRSEKAMKECVELTFDTGEKIQCTADHPWLSSLDSQQKSFRLDWHEAKDILSAPNLVRPFMPWETTRDYDTGWLAGILDGEGCLPRPSGKNGRGSNVTVAQNCGPTADKIQRLLEGIVDVHSYERKTRPGMKVFDTRGGMSSVARLLGTVRAERLIENFDITGGMLSNKFPTRVVDIKNIGIQEIQSIETESHTYIAEGFACHNTNYPELLDKRIVSRPRRFDRVIKIDTPSKGIREEYLQMKLPKKENLKRWIKETEGLSFAGITEAIISVVCLGNSIDETMKVLKDIENGHPSSNDFGTKGSLGFGGGQKPETDDDD